MDQEMMSLGRKSSVIGISDSSLFSGVTLLVGQQQSAPCGSGTVSKWVSV